MIAYNIGWTDTATPALQRVRGGISRAQINPIVGRAASEATREHYIQLNRERPNQLGGKRTQYYLGAARGTSFTLETDGVTISIRQTGLRLRYYGGRVTAGQGVSYLTGKRTRFLTIPVHPLAHGKRASEFDLELVYNHNGEPVALATKDTRGVSIRQTKTGKIVKRQVGQRGEIMFALKRSVMHQPDPSVAPPPDRIYGAVLGNLNAYVDRLIARAGGTGSS